MLNIMKDMHYIVFAMQVFLGCNIVSVQTKGKIPEAVDSSALDFSVDIMKVVAREKAEGTKIQKNIFMSPSCIFRASLLLYLATLSNTRAQLERALHMENNSIGTIQKYLTKTKETSGKLLEVERLYVDESINVSKPYEGMVSDSLKKVDMSDNIHMVIDEVNTHVKNVTRSMISSVLKDSWTPIGNSIFISVIYFKLNWCELFQNQSTSKKPFYTNGGVEVFADMMIDLDYYKYHDSDQLQCQVLGIEYKDRTYTMLVFLPKENGTQTIETLISQLTPSLIKDAYRSMRTEQIVLSFPKFKSNSTMDLRCIFANLGVTDIFTTEADFSIMTEQKIRLSNAFHSAKINLEEDCTEAASSTTTKLFESAPNKHEPFSFKANRPFMYMIYNTERDIPVFMGVMVNPTQ